MKTSHFLIYTLALSACAPSIEDLPLDDTDVTTDTTDTTEPTDTDVEGTGPISAPDAAGVRTAHLDATSGTDWVYVDVDTHALVAETDTWTLAFQRSNIKVNGGVSGSRAVELAWVDVAFDSATDAPDSGWNTDAADSNADSVPEYAFAWYTYDESTHVLSPKEGTWFVRTAGGATVAVEILDYYDVAGTSGMPSFRYKSVTDEGVNTPADHTLAVDASDSSAFVYVSLSQGAVVSTPTAPETDLTWDLAFKRATIRLNGGVNGAGDGEVITLPDETVYDDVSAIPSEGWTTDVTPPSPYEDGTALASWYNYNPTTHAVSASGRTHVVRDASGDAWKFTVESWADGQYGVRFTALIP